MQTFLPYSDFYKCAKSLDMKRLGKQRVEGIQIYRSLTIESYGWKQHPVVKMWRGHENALLSYVNNIIIEWISRGYKNNIPLNDIAYPINYPDWLGNSKLHLSHQSNLLRKEPNFYNKYNWKVSSDLPYYWCGFAKGEN